MIRQLRLTDVLLQLLPGHLAAQDFVTTYDEIFGGSHRPSPLQLLRWSLAFANREHCLASTNSGRLDALAVVRPRRGQKAWETAHLLSVASNHGEGLFFRVPLEATAQRFAERSGFRRAYPEDSFSLARPMAGDMHGESLNVPPPLPSGSYDIFRRYNAPFPAVAHSVIAVTFDQVQNAYVCGRGHVRKYVWAYQDHVRGRLRLDQHSEWVIVDAILHPEESEQVPLFASYVVH